MKMTKKVLALALSLIMIVSMFSIVPMSVSADASRADNWNGFITTTLNIGGSTPNEEGNYLTLSETDLYVGDSVKTNGQWLNYELKYTNESDEVVSSKINGNGAWYCEGTKMFESQLYYGHINGAGDTPVKFTKAGTWYLYAKLQDGKTLTLVTFEVKALPRFFTNANGEAIYTGSRAVKFYPQDGVPFSEDEIYVGDTLQNSTGGDWWKNKDNYPIHYTKEDGTEITGVITHLHFYGPNADLYYAVHQGNTNVLTFTNSGTYRVFATFEKVTDAEGNSLSNFEVTLRTFEVKALPREYVNMEGNTVYAGSKAIMFYPENGVPFSEDEIYVGDTLQNSTGGDWWLNKDNHPIEYTREDGSVVTGVITHLHFYGPNADLYYAVYHGNTNVLTFTNPGTYRVNAKFERVTDAEGNDVGDFTADLRTFEVKAAPRQYVDTEGNEVYTGSKAIKFYPQDGIPFDEDEIYVGDTIQNSTGGDWWGGPDAKQKYPISYTKEDGTVVTGVVTHLHFYGPNADLYFSLWQGNTNVLKFTKAGTYTVHATFEKVTDAEGNSLDKFDADLRTFEVKACPHNYQDAVTVAPTCDVKGYDSTVCADCGDEIKTNYVDAIGHDLTCTDGVVTCSACDYTRTYDAENTTVEIKVNAASIDTKYTNVEAAAFVGETLVNTNGAYWSDYTFTNGEYSGKVYNAWVVKGDLAYFEEYKANRAENDGYTDENVFYAQVGYGAPINYTFTEAGTYNLIGVIQYAETSTFLTDVHPFVMATIEVFDAPEAEAPHEHTEVTETVDATCTEPGSITVTCETCGETISTEEIPALGHTEVTTTVDATCTEPGSITVTCDVCGETLSTETIDALGHNYVDGTCSNCGEADPDAVVLPELKVKSVSMVLQSNISLNYLVEKSLFADDAYADPYMTFVIRGRESVVTEYTESGSNYVFTLKGIAPNELTQNVVATLYATANGKEYTAVKEFAAADYGYKVLELYAAYPSQAKLLTLIVDLLNYGAQAQIYTNFDTENLANAALTDAEKAFGTSETPTLTSIFNSKYETIDSPTVVWKSKTLILEDAVVMKYIFATDSVEGVTMKFSAAGMEWTKTAEDFVYDSASNTYYVLFNELDAGMMSEAVYITAYKDGVAVSNTVRDSIESYAQMNQTVSGLGELVIKMMQYGNAAKAYAG